MRYTQDEFFRLIEEIEFQGGEHLDETHDPVYHAGLAGPKLKGAEVKYCGEMALFEIPYEPTGHAGTLSKVKVCAVCDRLGTWPRFANADAKGRE